MGKMSHLSLSLSLLACPTEETKLWLRPSAKQCRNPCCGPPLVYQDLSTRHDWPVQKAIVDLPVRLKGNSKRPSGISLSPLDAQSRTGISALPRRRHLLVKLRLRRRLQVNILSLFLLFKLMCVFIICRVNKAKGVPMV